MALFMVATSPVWWVDVVERVAVWNGAPLEGSSSRTNEEEHKQHEEQQERCAESIGARPQPREIDASVADRTRSLQNAPLLRDGQIPAPHPAKLSTRRLI